MKNSSFLVAALPWIHSQLSKMITIVCPIFFYFLIISDEEAKSQQVPVINKNYVTLSDLESKTRYIVAINARIYRKRDKTLLKGPPATITFETGE